jgi:two-component system, NtrC family, nitrogen regulation sensor histidine kinase NtrY
VSQDELLRTIIDVTPIAMVLVGEVGTIVFANQAARDLFFEGRSERGANFLALVARAPEPLRRALASDQDHIFTFEDEAYHLGKRHFALDGKPHTLITVRHMTQEIARQDVAVLKKTLRVIGHELGNSMAPASSLHRSARLMLGRPEHADKLAVALGTVEERLTHLQGFVAGLARMGQLPKPRAREVVWRDWLGGLSGLWPGVAMGPAPVGTGWFDAAQIEQVLLNLVKNAVEAGSAPEETSVELVAVDGGVRITVADRGSGMSDEVLANALVPAFTTKPTGSGMGLALCREIVEAHGGRLRIGRRDGGGMAIAIWLPGRTVTPPPARLTLTGVR